MCPMIHYNLTESIGILSRTPLVLESLLQDLPAPWVMNNEGENTFSPFDVVGHLIHGEKTDWVARMEIILSDKSDKTFEPYDRFAQLRDSEGKTLKELLAEFKTLRYNNLEILKAKNLQEKDLLKTGTHPSLGPVTLQQLLSTWTIHDLSHIAQITRVMCKQYKEEVGPWINYLPVLTR
jgi:DinB superfamily